MEESAEVVTGFLACGRSCRWGVVAGFGRGRPWQHQSVARVSGQTASPFAATWPGARRRHLPTVPARCSKARQDRQCVLGSAVIGRPWPAQTRRTSFQRQSWASRPGRAGRLVLGGGSSRRQARRCWRRNVRRWRRSAWSAEISGSGKGGLRLCPGGRWPGTAGSSPARGARGRAGSPGKAGNPRL